MSTTLSASSLVNVENKTDAALGLAIAPETPEALRTKTTIEHPQLAKLMQSYQADQQLKYLHLQAEVEVLLQQLQTLKQRRLASTTVEGDCQ
jgi:hypothetical protein